MSPRAFADAICETDLTEADRVVTDVCIEPNCGAEIPVGFLRCPDCESAHEARQILEINDIRRG